MRSGNWRGAAIAFTLTLGASLVMGDAAFAVDIFHHAIPREVPAMDYRTGDVMMAPPIPGGHYTKDLRGCIQTTAGLAFGAIHGLAGKIHAIGAKCRLCGGPSCGQCGGQGLFHGKQCGGCGGDGCGRCGSGLFGNGLLGHHGGNGGCTDPSCGQNLGLGGHGHGHGLGLGHGGLGHGNGVIGSACVGCGTMPSAQVVQAAPIAPTKTVSMAPIHATPTAQSSFPSGQVSDVCGGCLGTGRHGQGGGCGLCGGTGRLKSLFGHGGLGHGGAGQGGPFAGHGNGPCGNAGCGLCGGNGHGGLLASHGNGPCGKPGCGLCAALGNGVAGLKGKAHSLLGLPLGIAAKVLHKGEIKYFVGAGGPVPITPGYVPYVVTTRSPRDFLAFPPFSDQIP